MKITEVSMEERGAYILANPTFYIKGVTHNPTEAELFKKLLRSRINVELKEKGLGLTTKIKKVIFNDPATIVLWDDGTKTIVKCQDGEKYDKEKGLALCISKKVLGNKGNYNEVFKKYIQYERKKIIKPAAKKAKQNAAQQVLQKLTP